MRRSTSPKSFAGAGLFALAVLILSLPSNSRATILFRFDPASSDQWAPGSGQVVSVQVRSDAGEVVLGGVQVDFTYDNTASGVSLTSIDTSAISSGQMSEDYTDATDDGDASLFRAVSFIGGGDTGYPLGSLWQTIAGLSFTVSTDPDYPIRIDVDLYAALDRDFIPLPTAWDGDSPGGEYTYNETAIDLMSFEARAEGRSVLVSWATATERDNAGFHVWRGDRAEGPYQKITSSLIPAEGDAFTGASYSLVDADVARGRTYFYKLEDVDIRGQSTFHGPVQAVVESGPVFGCGFSSQQDGVAAACMVALSLFALWRRVGRAR